MAALFKSNGRLMPKKYRLWRGRQKRQPSILVLLFFLFDCPGIWIDRKSLNLIPEDNDVVCTEP